jgi:hypothetical protein
MGELKKWTVTIEGVSAEDMKDLAIKAGANGLSIGSLLGSFINDLVDGAATNGSDERMYACQWFDRCFLFPQNTFLHFLVEWGYLEEALDAWKGIQDSEKYIKEIEEELAAGKLVCHRTKDNGEYSTWEDLVNSDGEPFYQSREAWEADERSTIEDEREYVQSCRETLDSYWKEYMGQKSEYYERGTFDEEMKKVLEWKEQNQQFLDD